jgi:hypothetical protein
MPATNAPTRHTPWMLGLVLACLVVGAATAAWWWDARSYGIACVDEEGERPVSTDAVLALAVGVGVPFALIVGPIVGVIAASIPRRRRIAIGGLAVGLASIVPKLAAAASCNAAGAMWVQAAVPALIAALVLERKTRPDTSSPTARVVSAPRGPTTRWRLLRRAGRPRAATAPRTSSRSR